jgi:putative phosphoesterase
LTRKLGILSDAHGNGPAFLQALAVLRENGAERFVFLGDAVGYIPSLDVVKSLMALGGDVRCILGNHESMLLKGDSRQDEVYKLNLTGSLVTEPERAFLQGWSKQIAENASGGRALFLHGSPKSPTNGYVYPDTDLSVFTPDAGFVFMGHTHHPFIRREGGRMFVNVGSCGLPRDDGRYGSVAIFDADRGEATVLRFDITEATREALAKTADVHPAVRNVYERRRDQIYGEMV